MNLLEWSRRRQVIGIADDAEMALNLANMVESVEVVIAQQRGAVIDGRMAKGQARYRIRDVVVVVWKFSMQHSCCGSDLMRNKSLSC
jgi:hypothetical protein